MYQVTAIYKDEYTIEGFFETKQAANIFLTNINPVEFNKTFDILNKEVTYNVEKLASMPYIKIPKQSPRLRILIDSHEIASIPYLGPTKFK